MKIIQFVIDRLKELKSFITPPKAYSWQTVILLSLFSWVMSLLATDLVRNFLANCGWIFLIWGVAWATSENPIKIGDLSLSPWITGALVSIYLFGRNEDGISPTTLISWPAISAMIAALPNFFDKGLKFRLPSRETRHRLINLFLSQLVISCWFQFYFVIESWVDQYPSLLADDFSNSHFVFKLPSEEQVVPRGGLILNLMEPQILEQLNNQPWAEIEQWRSQSQNTIETLIEKVEKELPQSKEELWWRFDSQVSPNPPGYNLQLQATWSGPRSQAKPYNIRKNCQINPIYQQLDAESSITLDRISEVRCFPPSPLTWE